MNREQYQERWIEYRSRVEGAEFVVDMLQRNGLFDSKPYQIAQVVHWRLWLDLDLLHMQADAAGVKGFRRSFEEERESFWSTLDELGGLMGEW